MEQIAVKIHKDDNVMVALRDIAAATTINNNGEDLAVVEAIPAKHKFFLQNMAAGSEVIMYGVLVGKTVVPVKQGSRVTTENLRHAATGYAWRASNYIWHKPDTSKFADRTFNGYRRSDGRVGTANYWVFIPLVFCENRNLDIIKDALQSELGYTTTEKYKSAARLLIEAYKQGKDITEIDFKQAATTPYNARLFENVEGIKFLTHTGGCGGTRQDAATLSRLLAAYANHPNVGGVTVLSLGCQNLQAADFLNSLKLLNPAFDKPLHIFEQQQTGTEEALIMQAIKQTFAGLVEINKQRRQPVTLDKLCIGVKCGGSDGFSGISANPAVGYCADLVSALNGKVLLAEFPELCGVEQNLVDRMGDEQLALKFTGLMKAYEASAEAAGSGFYMNPSPGNIKDGLITDAMKSAGAAKKGGISPVADVLDYTEQAVKPGLSLVCTPGNDVEATTGQAGAGATLILFTTGLGTPTGNPVCPTIKIATNSRLAKRMGDIIDIDTGGIIEGIKTIAQAGEEILEYCIKAASGEAIPKAVQLNQDDFIPWKRGISL